MPTDQRKPKRRSRRVVEVKPKRSPNWERDPRPVPGGVEIIGRCFTGQGIPIFIRDVMTLAEKAAAALGILPRCRHCGRPYSGIRKARSRS